MYPEEGPPVKEIFLKKKLTASLTGSVLEKFKWVRDEDGLKICLDSVQSRMCQ